MLAEKIGIRLVFGILCILGFVVLAAADNPPNLDQALAVQQDLVADRPYDAEVYNDLGNLLVHAGRHQEAEDAYRRAIELAPADTLARYNLGVLQQQTGRWKQAMDEFEGLLDLDARHARTHYQVGMLLHARGQRAKAVKHFAQAFAYDPELTLPANNPHIIDNELATEALLISQRYSDAPSSDMPRLYGEPERIVDLMLSEGEEPPAQALKSEPVRKAVRETGRPIARPEGGIDDDEEDADQDEDEDGDDDPGRRSLTSEDLGRGSTGQVQGTSHRPLRRSSSAGRETGRSGGGMHAVQPLSRSDKGSGSSSTGRPDGRSNPSSRYIPPARTQPPGSGRLPRAGRPPGSGTTSRYSTGRLHLELLPAESPPRDVVTATR